ncbi:hypothetical protein [Nesterenkonia sp. NBAIMH1]|uniref:hypothetical protein n=1 Tax=Nesterenkonia sp. NBAIMH1 TaxID=2600320 RepID=UPI0011B67EBF|nr:hypothetical protein [Nesterenkonia sp. NBAIMH1]
MPARKFAPRFAVVMLGGSVGYLLLKVLLPNTSWAPADVLPALFIIFLGALVNAWVGRQADALRVREENGSPLPKVSKMKHTKTTSRSLAAVPLISVLAVLFGGPPAYAGAASAKPETQQTSTETLSEEQTFSSEEVHLSTADLASIEGDLKDTGASYTVTQSDGTTFHEYSLTDGSVFGISQNASAPPTEPGHVTPDLSFGDTDQGFYILLNQTDQSAIRAGSTAVLTASICAINVVACVVASGAIASASEYIREVGSCPGGRNLRIDVQVGGGAPAPTGARCV